jgi:hypothetical protein
MKRVRGGYGLVGLFAVLLAVVAFLPAIRRMFARSFPEGFRVEGFRELDCKGVVCGEGEFCQENVCRPVAAPITNAYFPEK